ncbi:hypothetical protein [Spirosoma flavus]
MIFPVVALRTVIVLRTTSFFYRCTTGRNSTLERTERFMRLLNDINRNRTGKSFVIRNTNTFNVMKRYLFFIGLLTGGLASASFGQSNSLPQSASTTETIQTNPVPPTMNKGDEQRRLQRQMGQDTTAPKNRKQRRLRPDSLRRGGATRVDTIR